MATLTAELAAWALARRNTMTREQMAGAVQMAQTLHLDVPNMDCLDEDALLAWEGLFTLLAGYAQDKRQAMAYRLRGAIGSALKLEGACDTVYDILPPGARW
jgi:hypothetical protein